MPCKGIPPSPFNYKNSSYFNYPAKHALGNADSGFSRIIWWFHRLSINCIKEYFFFPLSTSCLPVSLNFLLFLCSDTRDGDLTFSACAPWTNLLRTQRRVYDLQRFTDFSLEHSSCSSQPFLVLRYLIDEHCIGLPSKMQCWFQMFGEIAPGGPSHSPFSPCYFFGTTLKGFHCSIYTTNLVLLLNQ